MAIAMRPRTHVIDCKQGELKKDSKANRVVAVNTNFDRKMKENPGQLTSVRQLMQTKYKGVLIVLCKGYDRKLGPPLEGGARLPVGPLRRLGAARRYRPRRHHLRRHAGPRHLGSFVQRGSRSGKKVRVRREIETKEKGDATQNESSWFCKEGEF